MLKRRFGVALITILMPTVVLAQNSQPATDDQVQRQALQQSEPKSDEKPEQKPPAAVGEAATKPTRSFFSITASNIGRTKTLNLLRKRLPNMSAASIGK